MPISMEQACNHLKKTAKPVIFIDTCTILDIINSLHLASLPKDYLIDFNKLSALQQSDDIALITAQNVQEEYNDNIESVTKTATKQIVDISRHVKVLQQLHNAVSGVELEQQEFSSYDLPSHAKNISDNVMKSCIIIQRKDEYSAKAMDRVRANIAPARRGGAEAKDCEIIECFLDLARSLRHCGHSQSITFLTANSNDYGKSGKLNPPLDKEFLGLNASYANHLNHALSLSGN